MYTICILFDILYFLNPDLKKKIWKYEFSMNVPFLFQAVLISLTASCHAGLLGAGFGEGSCAAAPYRYVYQGEDIIWRGISTDTAGSMSA